MGCYVSCGERECVAGRLPDTRRDSVVWIVDVRQMLVQLRHDIVRSDVPSHNEGPQRRYRQNDSAVQYVI